jgi:hypothetical protein
MELGASIVSDIPRRACSENDITKAVSLSIILYEDMEKHENEQPLCFRDMTVI